MTPVLFIILSFSVATGVVATLSGAGLALASQGRARIPVSLRLICAGAGALCLLLPGLPFGADASLDPFSILLSTFLGALLGSLALLDRMTAWAPDALTAPTVILAIAAGSASRAWDMGFIAAVCAGVSIFGAVQLLWALFSRSSLQMPPPPDIYGLLLPLLLFGFSLFCVGSYILLALMLILFKNSRRTQAIFSVPKAVSEAADDLGLSARPGDVVPLLAILCPVVILVWMIRDISVFW